MHLQGAVKHVVQARERGVCQDRRPESPATAPPVQGALSDTCGFSLATTEESMRGGARDDSFEHRSWAMINVSISVDYARIKLKITMSFHTLRMPCSASRDRENGDEKADHPKSLGE